MIGAVEAGMKRKDVTKKYGVSKSTLSELIKLKKETGSLKPRKRPGRPRKLTNQGEKDLIHEAKQHRRDDLGKLGKRMDPKVGKNTVRKVLGEHGLHRRKARSVPFLKGLTREKRRNWARTLQRWAKRHWRHVVWSDECYVQMGDKATVYVTRAADEEFKEECLVPQFTQSPLRLMVWAAIGMDYKSPIVILKYPGGKGGGMTAHWYRDQVLEPVLVEEIARLKKGRGHVTFMHDGAPAHRAKVTKEWFAGHNIELFHHPPSSPDLNPIENIWHLIKMHI